MSWRFIQHVTYLSVFLEFFVNCLHYNDKWLIYQGEFVSLRLFFAVCGETWSVIFFFLFLFCTFSLAWWWNPSGASPYIPAVVHSSSSTTNTYHPLTFLELDSGADNICGKACNFWQHVPLSCSEIEYLVSRVFQKVGNSITHF